MEDTQERSVIVLGRTGCGKSTFIRAMMLDGDLTKASLEAATNKGIKLPEVSWSVASCTKRPHVYHMPRIPGRKPYRLIDCMGLQDTDREDMESVKQMLKVLSCLTSLVGIVYIIDGRVTPSEAANCKYIFTQLLAGAKPADVLVVRSKFEDWDEYDADEEKLYLKDGIPEILRDAPWIAVDFDKYLQPDEGRTQVELIRNQFSRWTERLQLSDKIKNACDYVPEYLSLLQAEKDIAEKEKEMENCKMKASKMELKGQRQAKEADETNTKIKELQETLDKFRRQMQNKRIVEGIVFGGLSILGVLLAVLL